MTIGSVVVWIEQPYCHGLGRVEGAGKHGWLWITWADGSFDLYDPLTLELADAWEAQALDPSMFHAA